MMRKLLLAALFILPVLVLLPNLNTFPYHPDSEYSDLAISHYPNALFLQRSLIQDGVIPLWSPAILSGYPFAANPLAGLFYLPGLLALLFPLPFGFNMVIALHLIWGGVGMYLLLRAEGLTEFGAVFGALLFEAMPKFFGHLGAGHLTLLYAVPWTPWLLLAVHYSAGIASALRWVLPGLVLGLIALADVRWAAYAGLAWVAYSLRPLLAPRVQAGAVWQRAGDRVLAILSNTVVALLIAAPLLLPLLEYTLLSTRAELTPTENLIYSLPAQPSA